MEIQDKSGRVLFMVFHPNGEEYQKEQRYNNQK
jgi:hypothetical protein